mmetsp:Transcript_103632/g.186993  ORF Transcript_103632/g.186993 Transcript_103632/m.186993 type:complete len:234 (-) Transcript_103632:126-827(-)
MSDPGGADASQVEGAAAAEPQAPPEAPPQAEAEESSPAEAEALPEAPSEAPTQQPGPLAATAEPPSPSGQKAAIPSAPNASNQWPRGLTGSLSYEGDRLRTHAAVLGHLRVTLGYDFPLAYQKCSDWAEGIRRSASAPILPKGGAGTGTDPRSSPKMSSGASHTRRRQPAVEDKLASSPSPKGGAPRRRLNSESAASWGPLAATAARPGKASPVAPDLMKALPGNARGHPSNL